MSILSLFSLRYTGSDILTDRLCQKTRSRLFRDADIIERCSRNHHIRPAILEKALYARASVFNSFTHEKEYVVACLKSTLAHTVETEGQIFTGHTALLLPPQLRYLLRILITASPEWRMAQARSMGVAEREAKEEIEKADHSAALWTEHLWNAPPWHPDRYHSLLSMDTQNGHIADILLEKMEDPAFRITETDRWLVEDFRLASRVEVALSCAGHCVSVEASGGKIRLTVDKKAPQPSALADALYHIASDIAGVRDVEICLGPSSSSVGAYRQYEPSIHFKLLLVDDEQEFVQTLAERLRMRNIPSHAVFSGKDALKLLEEDPPDLILIDLKMPGMNGFEILAWVRKNYPQIGVIVLSGHGTEEDRNRCLDMGAAAYLQKPTDINRLIETLKKSYADLLEKQEIPE